MAATAVSSERSLADVYAGRARQGFRSQKEVTRQFHVNVDGSDGVEVAFDAMRRQTATGRRIKSNESSLWHSHIGWQRSTFHVVVVDGLDETTEVLSYVVDTVWNSVFRGTGPVDVYGRVGPGHESSFTGS